MSVFGFFFSGTTWFLQRIIFRLALCVWAWACVGRGWGEYPLDPDLMRPRQGSRGGIPAAMDIDFSHNSLVCAIHPNLHLRLSLTLRLCFNLRRKKNFPK